MTLRLSTRTTGSPALAPFLMAGDGGLDRTLALLHVADAHGAGLVELGVPFGDPVADGPVLQRAAERALSRGVAIQDVIATLARFRREGGRVPVVLFTYMNPLLSGPGLDAHAQDLRDAGGQGVLVPDLPLEESASLRRICTRHELSLVHLVAPTSSDARIRLTADVSPDLVYVVGRTGTTGRRTVVDGALRAYLGRVRDLVPKTPLAVGFGLADSEQLADLSRQADLAVIGTALADELDRAARRAIREQRDPTEACELAMGQFLDRCRSTQPRTTQP